MPVHVPGSSHSQDPAPAYNTTASSLLLCNPSLHGHSNHHMGCSGIWMLASLQSRHQVVGGTIDPL